ncbi:MAG: helix-turn-helix domain-containing protein [Candidatus Eisenbacteria bacterium]|nr:helix-turn-helix domain-containing protein [Candidatus Eisenbacteria bacterium]
MSVVPAPEPLLTVSEVSAWLRLHPKTVLRYVRTGRLPCTRLGGRPRFDRTQVARWLTERRNT